MTKDIKKGFGVLNPPQTILRDRISFNRIPDLLTERDDALSHQAAEYIFELESLILSIAKERFDANSKKTS